MTGYNPFDNWKVSPVKRRTISYALWDKEALAYKVHSREVSDEVSTEQYLELKVAAGRTMLAMESGYAAQFENAIEALQKEAHKKRSNGGKKTADIRTTRRERTKQFCLKIIADRLAQVESQNGLIDPRSQIYRYRVEHAKDDALSALEREIAEGVDLSKWALRTLNNNITKDEIAAATKRALSELENNGS